MNQFAIAVQQYEKTILELSARVATAAIELAGAQEKLSAIEKERDALKAALEELKPVPKEIV